MPDISFIILSTQRSGSTLLVNILDGMDNAMVAGEVFKEVDVREILHPEWTFDYPSKASKLLFPLMKAHWIRRHLLQFRSGVGTRGFKLMISQIDIMPEIVPLAQRFGYKFIILRRPDFLAQALSLELARAHNKWVNMGQAEIGSVNLSIQSVLKSLRFFRRSDEMLEGFARLPQSLTLYYDELVNAQEQGIKKVCKFLEIPFMGIPTTDLKPTSERSYSERIKNIEQLRLALDREGYIFAG